MNTIWVVSIVLQWLAIAALCVIVLSLVRQLGRVSIALGGLPGGAQPPGGGPTLRSPLPSPIPLAAGGDWRPSGTPVLLVWRQPGCAACEALQPHLAALGGRLDAAGAELLLIDADAEGAGSPAASLSDPVLHARARDLPAGLDVPRIPWALGVTGDGRVVATGAPQLPEDLDAMIGAARDADLGAAPGSERRHPWGTSLPYWEDGGSASPPGDVAGAVPGAGR